MEPKAQDLKDCKNDMVCRVYIPDAGNAGFHPAEKMM